MQFIAENAVSILDIYFTVFIIYLGGGLSDLILSVTYVQHCCAAQFNKGLKREGFVHPV